MAGEPSEKTTDGRDKNGSDNKPSIERRSILKTVGSASVLIGGVTTVGQVEARNKEKIITHKSAGRPAITEEVPKEWNEHLSTAYHVQDILTRKYAGRDDVGRVSLTKDSDTFAGKHGFHAKVETKSSHAREMLPDYVNGIYVESAEPEDLRREGCSSDNACHNEDVFYDTPGGVTFGGGTSMCQYWVDYDGDDTAEQTMLLAAHVVEISTPCEDDLTGRTQDQHCEEWGSVVIDEAGMDLVALSPNSTSSVDNTILEEFGEIEVAGHVTKDGLSNMISEGDTIYKTGIMTGTDAGTPLEIWEDQSRCDFETWYYEGAEHEMETASGDSGAPIYDISNSKAWAVSLHSYGPGDIVGTDCTGGDVSAKSGGVTAYEINNFQNGFFTKPP
jgi:hypothetical protein